MSFGVTGRCFAPSTQCYNCRRKYHHILNGRINREEENVQYKRCTGCYLLTYCDKECQREHWKKVHRRHCEYLAGKKPVQKHKEDSCPRCLEGKWATVDELNSFHSPKTTCIIRKQDEVLGKQLADSFGFHNEGVTCKCSREYACQIPFPLEQTPGKKVGPVLDEMFSHCVLLVMTMGNKAKSAGDKKDDIERLCNEVCLTLLNERITQWTNILICGDVLCFIAHTKTNLLASLVELRKLLGLGNPWYVALKNMLDVVFFLYDSWLSQMIELRGLDDVKYENFKELYEYRGSNIRNILASSKNNLWSKFKLWPQMGIKSTTVVVLLPEGIRCLDCNASLTSESNNKHRSMLVVLDLAGEPIPFPFWIFCDSDVRPDCLLLHDGKNNKQFLRDCLHEEHTFFRDARDCDECLKLSHSSHRCSDCLTVQYCSTGCQQKDLKFHLTVCSTWAKDPTRKLVSSRKQKEMLQTTVSNFLESGAGLGDSKQ